MIRIVVVGDIGSGKSYIAKQFGYPVFNADLEVVKLYRKSKKSFTKLKNLLPKYIFSFPINKKEISKAIIANHKNIKKISQVVHPEIKSSMHVFLKKNKNKKFVILDIPLLVENKLNKKSDIMIFIDAKKKDIKKRLNKRMGFNKKIIKQFKKLQLPLEIKKKKSDFIIKNNFNHYSAKKNVKNILEIILKND